MYRQEYKLKLSETRSANVRHQHFDSIHEIMRMNPTLSGNMEKYRSSVLERGKTDQSWWGWYGGFDKLNQMLDEGWPEGLAKMDKYLGELSLPVMRSARRVKKRAAFGDEVDIQRIYNGDLERAWSTTERQIGSAVGRHNAIIQVDVSTSASVSSEKAFWRGAAATALTKILVESGRNVQILITETTSDVFVKSRDYQLNTIMLKEFDQPMNIENVMLCTSVGFHRGYVFKAKLLEEKYVCQGSLGYPEHTILPQNMADDNVRIIRIPRDILSLSAAQRLINDVINGYQQAA